MTRTARTLIAACLMLLAAAAPATAAESAATQRSITIACQAFPAACAVQTPRIVWDASLDARDHDGEAIGRVWIDGAWQTVEWLVAIRPGMSPQRECDVIVHEFGHLTGIDEHTAEGVMSANGGEWPACHPPIPRRQAARDLIVFTLPRGHEWRVNCDRLVRRCVARSTRARQPRRFTVAADGSIETEVGRGTAGQFVSRG